MKRILLAAAAAVAIVSFAAPASAHDFVLNGNVVFQDVSVGPQAAQASASAFSSAGNAIADATALNAGNVASLDLTTKGDDVVIGVAAVVQNTIMATQNATASAFASAKGNAHALAVADNIGNAASITSSVIGH